MNLYYAEWPDHSVSIVHAENSLRAYEVLDQECAPENATVWVCNEETAIICSKRRGGGLVIERNLDYGWARVIMPRYERVYGRAREL